MNDDFRPINSVVKYGFIYHCRLKDTSVKYKDELRRWIDEDMSNYINTVLKIWFGIKYLHKLKK